MSSTAIPSDHRNVVAQILEVAGLEQEDEEEVYTQFMQCNYDASLTIERLVENPFKTVKHKHRPPKDVEKPVAARLTKTSSVSSSVARSRKREGRNGSNNATETSKRSSSKAIDGKPKHSSSTKGSKGTAEGSGTAFQRSNGYHRQPQGGRQNRVIGVQDRGQRNGRESRSWSSVMSEPVQRNSRKAKQHSNQAQERHDMGNGQNGEFQTPVDRKNDAKDNNAAEGDNQRQAQVEVSNDTYLANVESSIRETGRQLQQFGVEYDIANRPALSAVNNDIPVEMDIAAKLRSMGLGSNIPNSSTQAQSRTENMPTTMGEGPPEELQFGTFGISTYPVRDAFNGLNVQDPSSQTAEAQRDSMGYPVEAQPMYPPKSAPVAAESKTDLQENGGRSPFVKGAGQRELGDYHNQLSQPSDLSHIQIGSRNEQAPPSADHQNHSRTPLSPNLPDNLIPSVVKSSRSEDHILPLHQQIPLASSSRHTTGHTAPSSTHTSTASVGPSRTPQPPESSGAQYQPGQSLPPGLYGIQASNSPGGQEQMNAGLSPQLPTAMLGGVNEQQQSNLYPQGDLRLPAGLTIHDTIHRPQQGIAGEASGSSSQLGNQRTGQSHSNVPTSKSAGPPGLQLHGKLPQGKGVGNKLDLPGLPTQDMVSGSAAQMQGQYGGVPSGPAYNNTPYYTAHFPYAMSHPYQFMPAPYNPYGQVAANAAYSLPQAAYGKYGVKQNQQNSYNFPNYGGQLYNSPGGQYMGGLNSYSYPES